MAAENQRMVSFIVESITENALFEIRGLIIDPDVVCRWYKIQKRFGIECIPFNENQLKVYSSLGIDVGVFDSEIGTQARLQKSAFNYTKEESLQILDDLEDILVKLEIFSFRVVG